MKVGSTGDRREPVQALDKGQRAWTLSRLHLWKRVSVDGAGSTWRREGSVRQPCVSPFGVRSRRSLQTLRRTAETVGCAHRALTAERAPKGAACLRAGK